MGHRHRHGCGPARAFRVQHPRRRCSRSRRARLGRRLGAVPLRLRRRSRRPGRADVADGGGCSVRASCALVLLKLIADEPRHGYDLIRAIEELTDGEYAPSPGVIYPTLTLLQDMGLIEEAAGEGARKPFQVTDEGRAHLEEKADEVEALFERLEDEFAPHERSSGGPPIGRAVGNLMTALRHRVGRDGIDEDLLHEIATILDEAAQRIERVK